MSAARYDFARPGKLAGELEQRLTAWLKAAAALAGRKWPRALPFAATLAPAGIQTARPRAALAGLPDPCVAYQVRLGAAATLLALPRPVIRALVAGLLGDATGAPVADRDLTPVEESLCQYFLEELLLALLCETWTDAAALELALGPREANPQFSRVFADSGNVACCNLAVAGPFGKDHAQWLVPVKALAALFGDPAAARPADGGTAGVGELVDELPVEIAVVLGRAELALSQVARLGVGDIVVLDQRTAEPLAALVGGGPKLRGWAGRVGGRLAFQIDSLADGD
jgi:flagellar motor switch protein FliM